MLKGRRATIADLNKYHKEVKIINIRQILTWINIKKSWQHTLIQKEPKQRKLQLAKIRNLNPKGKGAGETINLEKQFVKGLQNLGGIYGAPTSLPRPADN